MRSTRLLAIICAALLPLTCLATPITFEFSGRIGMAGGMPPPDGSPFVPVIPLGTEFTGFFTYENEAPLSYANTHTLWYQGAVTDASISFGTGGSLGVFNFAHRPIDTYSTESSFIGITNDAEFEGELYDQFTVIAALASAAGDPPNIYRSLFFSFGDFNLGFSQLYPTGQTLLDPIPAEVLGINAVNFRHAARGENGQWIESSDVGGLVASVTQVQRSVPEPGTLSLLAAGLAGVWLATRRRVGSASRAC